MKHNETKLEVDVIGGQAPLSKEEDKAITAYLLSLKEKGKSNQFKAKAPSSKSLKAAH